MAVLGLLLVLATAALTADVVVQNVGQTLNGEVFGQAVTGMTPAGVFVAGAVTALVFALGVAMLVAGVGRLTRRRRERKVIVKRHAKTAEQLRVEKEQLERELAEERAARSSAYPDGAEAAYPTDGEAAGRPAETTAVTDQSGRRGVFRR